MTSLSNCKYCDGSGKRPCSLCRGKSPMLMHSKFSRTCENCNGTKKETCTFCKGMGKIGAI